MAGQGVPTLGRVIQFLRDLGFVAISAKPGVLAYAHAASGAEFLFRDRPADSPARETELVNLRVQLTLRGLLTETEFDRFRAGTTQPTTSAP